MKTQTIRIDELHIRLPGTVRREEATRLAEEVGRRIVGRLPAMGPVRSLGALELRLPYQTDSSPADLAELIAGAIVRGMSSGGGHRG